ncbi:hypothetical protein [Stappia sp. ES.058]|uniref:hypothetical protein n=1 Tax=Stappia sp. ES.058 TaxID=1881061 RepID=UPI00087BA201|nr:hypothetical protein [Stappia sp. ES.058]SDU43019.1 N-terminal domain of uncharacterized protein YciW-containing protein [Stappia sp. ES.058]
MTSPRTTALSQAHVLEGSGLANANAGRADIFEMTQAAEDAVLRPREPGAWSLPLRSALAARIARRNGEAALCDKYVADAANFSQLADPSVDGTEEGLVEVVSFTDKVATETKRVGASDIAALKDASISDEDIVRLAELNAFISYQIRVIAGLRLMAGGVA